MDEASTSADKNKHTSDTRSTTLSHLLNFWLMPTKRMDSKGEATSLNFVITVTA